MTISMYQSSAPIVVRALQNLSHVLEKGAAQLRDGGRDPDEMLGLRIVDDMLPLSRQVQIATDMAKNGVARLAGVDPIRIADDETSYEQLQARIARVIAYVRGFTAEQVDGSESRRIVVPSTAAGELLFDGQDYLLGFVLPNLYFHITVAYTLLRQAGVPIGKLDYMGVGAKRD